MASELLFVIGEEMNRALISLSFDDGRADSYINGYTILKQYNLPATFNITTGFINREISDFVHEGVEPMTKEMILDLYRDPCIEIAGHGNYHQNTKEDLIGGIDSLCSILDVEMLDPRGNGLASPYSGMSVDSYHSMEKELLSNHVRYIRLSYRIISHFIMKTIARKISRIFKSPILFSYAYRDTLMQSLDGIFLYSIPILSSTSSKQIKAIIDKAVKSHSACILMFHSIVEKKNARDNWDYEKVKFENICQLLVKYRNQNKIEIVTSIDLYNRLK
jgi:hypothetical protein